MGYVLASQKLVYLVVVSVDRNNQIVVRTVKKYKNKEGTAILTATKFRSKVHLSYLLMR